MIEIDGVVTQNAFSIFDEQIKGKKKVIFARVDVQPLKVYENWKDEKQGYGPSGSPVSIGSKHAIAIPMEFITLQEFKTNNLSQCHVRYYVNKTVSTIAGGQQVTIYDTGDGGNSFLFTGDSISIDVTTATGKELYRCLMAHPSNADFPAHGPKKPPLFRLLKPEEASKQANERKRKANQAIAWAYNNTEVPDSLAVKLHKAILHENGGYGWEDTDSLYQRGDMETLRNDLANHAELQPDEFMEMVKSANLGLRNTINEAYEYRVLDYTNKKWLWGEKIKSNVREICEIAVGQDPIDRLIEYMLYDKKGKAVQQRIVEELEKSKAGEQAIKNL